MLFSLLIPVYNMSEYLDECFKSIKDQTFKDFEVIIVDDGSTDNSGDMCEAFKSTAEVPVTVVHKKNQGLIAARRDAIALAKGEYCVFLDSDDFLDKSCFEVLSKRISDNHFPDMVMYRFDYYSDGVYSSCKYKEYEDGKIYKENEKKVFYEALICGNELDSMFSKATKTSIVKSDRTDYTVYYGLNMSEDLLQSLYLFTSSTTILYVCDVLYHYRYNRESISRNCDLKTIEKKNSIHVYYKLKEYLNTWGMDTSEWKKRLDANWLGLTIYWLRKTYMEANGRKQRLTVISYPWSDMVDADSLKKIDGNGFVDEKTKKIWQLIILNDYKNLEKIMCKEKIKYDIKRIKQKVKALIWSK